VSTKLQPGRCVKFIDSETGGWQIGRVMMLPASAGLCYRYEFCPRDDTRLVQTSPGGELVIVADADLSPYPASPIPVP